MARATALANNPEKKRGAFHLVALLKRGKSWIAIKANVKKTHPKSVHNKPSGHVCRSLHAEENVLLASRPGDTLFVLRYHVDGSLGMAKPCPDCQQRIRDKGIKRVWYTDEEGNFQRMYV